MSVDSSNKGRSWRWCWTSCLSHWHSSGGMASLVSQGVKSNCEKRIALACSSVLTL